MSQPFNTRLPRRRWLRWAALAAVVFVPLAFAGLLVTGAMGIAMYAVAGTIEARMTGWAMRGGMGSNMP